MFRVRLVLFLLSWISWISVATAQAQPANRCSVSLENTKVQTEAQPLLAEVQSTLQSKEYIPSRDGKGLHIMTFQVRYSDAVGEDITKNFSQQSKANSKPEFGYISLIFKFLNQKTEETVFYTAQSGLIQINGFYERYLMSLNARAYSDEQLFQMLKTGKISSEQHDKMLEAKKDTISDFVAALVKKALGSLPNCLSSNQGKYNENGGFNNFLVSPEPTTTHPEFYELP